jgi:uncharacterized OB-fold protein
MVKEKGFKCELCGRITYTPKHSMCKGCYAAWKKAKNAGYGCIHSGDCSGIPVRRL